MALGFGAVGKENDGLVPVARERMGGARRAGDCDAGGEAEAFKKRQQPPTEARLAAE